MIPLSLEPCIPGCGGYNIGPAVHVPHCPNRGKWTPPSLVREIESDDREIARHRDRFNAAVIRRAEHVRLLEQGRMMKGTP